MGGGVTRRTVLSALGGAGLLSQVRGGLAQQQFTEVWPQFGFTSANTGFAPQNTGISGSATELWQFTAGTTLSEAPAVTTDSVYVPGYDQQDRGFIAALSRADGSERWRFTTGDRLFSAPTYDSGSVYFVGLAGDLYSLEATSGQEEWHFSAGGRGSGAPKVHQGAVYFGTDEAVLSVSTTDGKLEWAEGGLGWVRAGAIADDTVVVGVGGGMGAFSAADGRERWQSTTEGLVDVIPCVANDTAYVGCVEGITYAVDMTSGDERWRKDTGTRIGSPPAVVSDQVFVGDTAGVLYALDDTDDGEILWTYNTGGAIYSAPAIVGDTVYVGSYDNHLYAIDRHTGDRRWRLDLDDKVFSPVIADGEVYVGTGDGVAHAVGSERRGTSPSVTIEASQTTTTVLSPVTLQVTAPSGSDYRYGWTISAPNGSFAGLLHTTKSHTAFLPDVSGSYDISVTIETTDGSKVGAGSKTILVEPRELETPDGLAEFIANESAIETAADLAKAYAPRLHFHRDEEFFPTRVETFVENAQLQVAGGDTTLTEVSMLDLGDSGFHSEYDPADPDNRLHFAGTQAEMAALQSDYPSTVYVSMADTEFRGDSYFALTYWCFYMYDPKKGDLQLPPNEAEHLEALIAAHTSDVESVMLLFDRDGPQWVGASQHHSGTYVRWEKVSKSDTHIDVYPGVHAHSMFLVDTEAYDSSIPAQLRWLYVDRDETNVLKYVPASTDPEDIVFGKRITDLFFDVTASDEVWTPGEGWNSGEYDLAWLPPVDGDDGGGDGNWLAFTGGFTSEAAIESMRDMLTGDSDMDFSETKRPINHFRTTRRTDPGPWITDRMLQEIDILDDDILSIQLAYLQRNIRSEPVSFNIVHFTNPGKKPHTFIADIHIETGDGSIQEDRLQKLPLGWDESTTIRIPLETVSFPSNEEMTIDVDILTYRPSIQTTDVVYSTSITAKTTIIPRVRLRVPDWTPYTTQRHLSDDLQYSMDDPALTVLKQPGDVVSERVEITNESTTKQIYYVGLSAVSQTGRRFDNDGAAGRAVSLDAGETREITLDLEISAAIPEGTLSLLVEAWMESSHDDRLNLLARRKRPGALEIDKPDGRLAIETSPAEANVVVDGTYLGTAPTELTLTTGEHEVLAFLPDYESVETTAFVEAGQTTRVSLTLGSQPADPVSSSEQAPEGSPPTGRPTSAAQLQPEHLAGAGVIVAGLGYLAVRMLHQDD